MRKIDIERSRDSYKKCLNSALRCMVQMAGFYEKREKPLIKKIKELEEKLKHFTQDKKQGPLKNKL